LIGYILFIYLLITVEPRLVAILIGQLIGHCFLSMYLSMEHNGLPNNGNILNKTRSIKVNKLVKLIMWNMPYHAEHHAFPVKTELIHKNESPLDFHLTNISKFLYYKGTRRK